jgi:mRNA interferase MazF
LKRGDIVIVRQGKTDASKARPCLVVQSDALIGVSATVTVCPLTSELGGLDMFRIALSPSSGNGLRKPSEIEIDRVQHIAAASVAVVAGQAGPFAMRRVDEALRRWLDL